VRFDFAINLALDGRGLSLFAVERRFLSFQHKSFPDAVHAVDVHVQPCGDFAAADTAAVTIAVVPQQNLRVPDLLGRRMAITGDGLKSVALFLGKTHQILIGS